MKNGKCPMCSATEVYTNLESEFRASGDVVELTDIDNDLALYITPYVCVNCGFVAMFVQELEEAKGLTRESGWKKV